MSGLCIDINGIPRSSTTAPTTRPGLEHPGRTTPITYARTVTDNAWHHVVLSGAGTTQTLYLDGVASGTISCPAIEHRGADFAYIGNGKLTRAGPMAPARRATSASPDRSTRSRSTVIRCPSTQVAAHYVARTATSG